MRRHYAASNLYADDTSVGFANTWEVLCFDSRAERDYYVSKRDSKGTRAILKREVTEHVSAKPRPYTREAYVVDCEGRVTVGYEGRRLF